MTALTWLRVRDLFHQALDVETRARCQWLGSVAADSEVRREVKSLLAHEPGGRFLEGGPAFADPAPRTPERLGPYRLVREIGNGGMGVVFEAVREEEAFSQTVAIKVLRPALLDREQARAFRRERQALSAIDHPNVARLIDWGETPDGRAFLVIEYVRDARHIDEYCRAHELSVREMLTLFLQVCDAVGHAHRHLIVHSDIKPANVLVAADGRAKLLDFGIARLLDPTGDATATIAIRMTPAYASPEQAKGGPVTTASDVYSLGVLLRELIGRPRGDLQTIVAKATEQDPQRRYVSVERFAADLRNLLDGRPVDARRADWWYRTKRFVARNRLSTAAVALATISISVGAGVATWKAQVANAERARAVRRFREVQELSRTLIFDLHDAVAKVPGAVEARRIVVSTALRYLDKLQLDDSADDSLTFDVAAAYIRIARVQWTTNEASLGDRDGARRNCDKAASLIESIWRGDPFDVRARDLLFQAAECSATLETDSAKAVEAFDRVLPLFDRGIAAGAEPRFLSDKLNCLVMLAQRLVFAGDLERARREALRALDLSREQVKGRPRDIPALVDLTRAENAVALVEGQTGNLDAAIAGYEKSRQVHLTILAIDPGALVSQRGLAVSDSRISDYLGRLGRLSEASSRADAAIRRALVVSEADPKDANATHDLVLFHTRRGRIRSLMGRRREALADFEAAVAAETRIPGENRHYDASHSDALNELGFALIGQSAAGSAALFRQAFELVAEDHGNIEFTRQRARALYGLALVAASVEERAGFIRKSLAAWQSLRARSPLDGVGLDDQRRAEELAVSFEQRSPEIVHQMR